MQLTTTLARDAAKKREGGESALLKMLLCLVSHGSPVMSSL